MPYCFTLTPKGANEPEELTSIDAKMCARHGASPHPRYWFNDWFSYIGLKLAVGKSFDEIEDLCREEIGMEEQYNEEDDYIAQKFAPDSYWTLMLKITQWLKDNYIAKAWYETK